MLVIFSRRELTGPWQTTTASGVSVPSGCGRVDPMTAELVTASAILSSQAALLILALGLLPALTADTLDLSAPATLGIADTLVGELSVVHHWPLWGAITAVLACGALIGSLNAVFIVGFGVDPIVVTLGTGTLLGGAALGINIVPTAGISAWLVSLTRHPICGLQLVFYLGLVLALATWYFATYTPTGRHLFFVGAGPDVARLTGINVARYRTAALVYGSVIASIAGWWDALEWFEEVQASRPDGYTSEDGSRTVVIPEILVKSSSRRIGVARSMHDDFLSGRGEQRAGLRVLPNNLPAKAAYLKWGWNTIGMVRPVPEAPLYECMVKSLH